MASFSLPGFAIANAVAQSSGVKGSAATRIGLVGGLFGSSPIGILAAKQMADSEAKRSGSPPPDAKPPSGKGDARNNTMLVAEPTSAPPSAPEPPAAPASPKRA
ncbi:hypothetical protein SCH01S_01_00400 [Sphingomonas changbaiensis NBRC 104936]|uniref:Uncharacterized protein n=1 Tax=Sphingomonas changbaiensis NBRC 104936 TaxID=1219043 RepID=A0A0E9MJA1_9SPHN|nr:hypothetical protein [Sphingomonas changbaiensis]GAO37877.1 hypothetical protein SCH01S_01_00400 [Sphingomonas changbaiensis NBRC 104936]